MRQMPVALRALLAMLSVAPAVADAPEYFGCGAIGRTAEVQSDGSVVHEMSPARMARIYTEHCDLVAMGRFSAITITDYDEKRPENVKGHFLVDEVLHGPQLDGFRIRVDYWMLVQPGESVSRNFAANLRSRHTLFPSYTP